MLKTWGCSNDDEHININNIDFCSILLKQLNVETNEIDEVLRAFERDVTKHCNMKVEKNVTAEEIKKLRRKRKQFIQKFDQEKLGCFAAKIIGVFDETQINNEIVDEDLIVIENCENKTFLLDKNKRKNQILLGYAILNLNKSEECRDLLKTILHRCAKEDSFLNVERDFIWFLWKHLELIPPELTLQLLDNFGFLYEKPILKACCAVLKESEIEDEINTDLKRIAKIPQLRERIASIFCDLFFLSRQNEKLLRFYQNVFS